MSRVRRRGCSVSCRHVMRITSQPMSAAARSRSRSVSKAWRVAWACRPSSSTISFASRQTASPPFLHVRPRAHFGVGIRPDHLPQPSSSAPSRITLQQADDFGEVEHPEELGLSNGFGGEPALDRAEVQQRARHSRRRDATDDTDLIGLELGLNDSDAFALLRARPRRHLWQPLVRAEIVERRGRAMACDRLPAGGTNGCGQTP